MSPPAELSEPVSYRVKTRLLGQPLSSRELDEQRLGIPTALAVFSSDCISSSAYATEEILHVLIPVVGLYAFSLVVPVTVAILVMLTFLVLSYRQTIRAYPAAGGAYMVTRDNFGYRTALVAGMSLLTGYTLTVAVSASAGVAALTSVAPALGPYTMELAVAVVVLIAYLNLRGTRESGKIFMVPTYLFIAAMILMIAVGLFRDVAGGGLPYVHIGAGTVGDLLQAPHGTSGIADSIMKGAGLWVVLGAFASGSSALTGVEAISNGVSAFRPVEWVHARRTLVIMGTILGTFFIGLGLLSTMVHPVPYESGTPTVISQVGKVVFGSGPLGSALYLFLQASTLLVLVLGANTSFADFPRLSSFAAGDSYLPRQLMKRGHRLVFSNGIILLATLSIVLIIVADASVNRLIPFYGIGVFTSFTMSQAGMAKHHLTHREPRWRIGLFINGLGCAMTATVTLVFFVKFAHQGVWVLLILVPALVIALVRLNRQYLEERAELAEEAPELVARRPRALLTVIVLVHDLNRATAGALLYARSLDPTTIRAVHVADDIRHARELEQNWLDLGFGDLPLEIVPCPNRRIAGTAQRVVAEEVRRGDREVSVLLPLLQHHRLWHRVLHDRTAARIARVLNAIPGVGVTFVPYRLRNTGEAPLDTPDTAESAPPTDGGTASGEVGVQGIDRIGSVRFRDRVNLEGHVRSLRVQPWSGVATLEVTLADATGEIDIVFLGRRTIAGIEAGTHLRIAGMVGEHHGRRAVLNPRYTILQPN